MEGDLMKEGLTAAVGGCSIWASFLSWQIKCKITAEEQTDKQATEQKLQYKHTKLKTHLFSLYTHCATLLVQKSHWWPGSEINKEPSQRGSV